jgi:hypothetical protein
MISQLGWPSSASTVDAAEDLAFLFHSMSNDAAATVRASRREPLYRAFEAVENVTLPGKNNFESLVVVISADLTFSHL